VIAMPAETHFNFAWEALSGGKHVFVEKPISLTVEAREKLAKAVESSTSILGREESEKVLGELL
jgi:predicted dehydrogenase